MKTMTIVAALLNGAFLVAAVPQGPIQPCTTTIDKEPPLQVDCTFKSHLVTTTKSINCHGCAAISTLELGVGLQCQKVTTIPGTATSTSTVCKSSTLYASSPSSASASPTASTCTTTVGKLPSQNLSPTLTTYVSTATTTSYVSCGGCAIATRHLGPGPARRITTTTTLPITTETAYACSSELPPYY